MISIEILNRNCLICKQSFQTYDQEKLCCGTICKKEYMHKNRGTRGRPKSQA